MNRKKILLVDDEKSFTDMLKLNLEYMGNYDVRVENDSTHAFSTALEFKPNIILLDVIMPKMEGPDVAIEFKKDPLLREIPVVFLTATVKKDEVDAHAGVIGGHTFVAKPTSMNVLIYTIERNMNHTQEQTFS